MNRLTKTPVPEGKENIREDFYSIPFQDKYLIYRPLRSLVFVGNQALVRYLEQRIKGRNHVPQNRNIEKFLRKTGFWRAGFLPESLPEVRTIRPLHAVLLMTNRCNLRCTYCYANAGTSDTVKEVDWPTAKTVIDAVAENAIAISGVPSLTFHGGGEPTLNWAILVKATEYMRSHHPESQISMSSNGIWSRNQMQFILSHFNSVSISMDGISEVQNRQRPTSNCSGSFNQVRKTLELLDQAGMSYGVRMTVLPQSVSRLVEGVNWLCRNTQAKTIQIEPTFTSARGIYGDYDNDFADAFCSEFMKAWDVARKLRRHIYYSGARPWVTTNIFCRAPLDALVLSADGSLVSCFEIFDPAGVSFLSVGKVRKGHIEHDYDALGKILEEQKKRRVACRACFCYWHCAGDCVTRRRNLKPLVSGRCRVNRTITRELLAAYASDGCGIWQGLREQVTDRAQYCSNPASGKKVKAPRSKN